MDKARTLIHIGMHKTGSTSIQTFLGRHREKLNALGVAFYLGKYGQDNHFELHAALRRHRLTGFKVNRPGLFDDIDTVNSIHQAIDNFSNLNKNKRLLFSSEGLSLIRYPDEAQWLKETLPGPHEIIVFVREKQAYIDSYREEIEKYRKKLAGKPVDKDSFMYTEPDTWLLDYATRISTFTRVFGSQSVRVVDFDLAVSKYGSVIPAFLDAIDVSGEFKPESWEGIFLNARKK